MKTKQLYRNLKLLIIVGGVFFAQMLCATDIVGYSMLTGTAGAATSGVGINYPSKGRVLGVNGVTSKSFTNAGNTCSMWSATNVGIHGWQSNAFSTAGYIQTAISGQISASTLGPRDLKAQYSLNGTSWTDVVNDPAYLDDNPILTLTGQAAPFKFRLPEECDNKTTVYFRIIQNSTVSQDGRTVVSGTNNTATIKAVVVQSELFSAPTSQSSGISIISVTPTTITVGCTYGSGNKRILKMNTTNSFTDPTDDYNPNANLTYNGGEQVMYNGSLGAVTVNVSSSLNQYWFRYYDYNSMDNLTRYCTLGPYSTNPKLCALPYVHSPTYTFGLVRATLGATVEDNGNSSIIDMGVYWFTSPNVNSTKNGVQHLTPGLGAFTVTTDVDRGSMIYFKGYAENESGVIFSEEASFSNRPIFSGVGNWEIPSLWNTNEVPGANGDKNWGSVLDSPTINGTCTQTVSNGCTDLTINSGQSLTINPAITLTVNGTLSNNNSTDGLLVKSSDSQANGSIIFADPTLNTAVPATVEMYSKASWNLGAGVPENSRYKWQYFGIPVSEVTAIQSFYMAHVRRWEETGDSITNHWVSLDDHDVLYPFLGYEVCQSAPKTYSFKGNLVVSDFNITDLAYTSTALYPGQHIFANPYAAAIDISSLAGMFGSNMEESVYLYNTGSYDQWNGANGSLLTGSNAGQYTVSTPATVGEMGVPTQIPSMQAFLVKAISDNPTNSSLAFAYSNIAVSNTERQRAPKKNNTADDDRIVMRIDVTSKNTSDQMWLFVDETKSRKFDNGWDGRKLFGSIQSSQLYAIEDDGYYQIDALNDVNNTIIGFKKGVDSEYVLKISHKNLNKMYANVYLQDLMQNKVIDITQSDAEYLFTADSNPITAKRFKILVRYHIKDENGEPNLMKVFSADKSIYVQNSSIVGGDAALYDMFGHFISRYSISSNSITKLPVTLSTGAYIVKTVSAEETFTQRVTVK